MILYLENTHKKFLETVILYSKVQGYKVNMQKYLGILYTIHEAEKEILKKYALHICASSILEYNKRGKRTI